MIRRTALFVAVPALVAGCATEPLPEPFYPASHPASPQAPAAPFVRPANVLSSDLSFPARNELTSGTGRMAMKHDEGVDHSAMGHGAASGTADTIPNADARANTETAQAGSGTPPSGTGTVHSVDGGQRMVNVSHEPIPSIGWPAMTMDFRVAPSVDLLSIQPGSRVTFTLARGADGTYVIEALRPASGDGGSMPGMNHEQMDHGSMPGMDH